METFFPVLTSGEGLHIYLAVLQFYEKYSIFQAEELFKLKFQSSDMDETEEINYTEEERLVINFDLR